MEPINRPGDRSLTREDLPGILGALGIITAFIVLTAIGHPYWGAAVFSGGMVFAFRAMPREQREAVGRELEHRDRTPLGRTAQVAEIAAGLALLYFIARAILTSQ